MKISAKTWGFTACFAVGLAGFFCGVFLSARIPHVEYLLIVSFVFLEARILYGFFSTLFHEHTVGEEMLVIVASAITIALGDYWESLSLVIMYMIGEFIIHLIERNNSPAPDEHDHKECCCHPHTKTGKGVLSFVRYYIAAVIAGIVIVLFLSLFMDLIDKTSIFKTLAILLLIACPCALFISTPLCKYYAMKALSKISMRPHDLADLDEAAKTENPEQAEHCFEGTGDKAEAFRIAKHYKRKVIQNIVVIIAAKIVFMVLSLYYQNTIFAVAADLVIALAVFLNSTLLLRKKKAA